MNTKDIFEIAVLPGDGVGIEVIAEAVKVLNAVQAQSESFQLKMREYPCGALCYRESGNELPKDTLAAAKSADAVLLGAMGDPAIRKPDGTELIPQVTLRVELDLFAGVRPVKLYPGVKSALAGVRPGEIDFVIIREQTEGLFASQNAGIVLKDEVATDTMVMTRKGIERVCRFAFELSKHRSSRRPDEAMRVTCVDKANIFKSFAFFRKVFAEVATEFPDVENECNYIDAQALHLLQRPQYYDVIVTENMFGDILSDLAAGLVGGMGMAPSADIGTNHAVFQPAHGTAPDIAGKSIANPIAAILSAGMMLDWLGTRHNHSGLQQAGRRIEEAVAGVLGDGRLLPADQRGNAATSEIGDAVAGFIYSESDGGSDSRKR